MEVNIYLAGPLFSIAEREFNLKLAKALTSILDHCSISVPQEFAASVSGQEDPLTRIFQYSLESIQNSDLIVAVLDGPDVDSGTCVEIGYAYALKKPIIGIRTDFRASEDKGVNLMVSNACTDQIWFQDSTFNFDSLLKKLIPAIKKLLSLKNNVS